MQDMSIFFQTRTGEKGLDEACEDGHHIMKAFEGGGGKV